MARPKKRRARIGSLKLQSSLVCGRYGSTPGSVPESRKRDAELCGSHATGLSRARVVGAIVQGNDEAQNRMSLCYVHKCSNVDDTKPADASDRSGCARVDSTSEHRALTRLGPRTCNPILTQSIFCGITAQQIVNDMWRN